jgi:hypothetical protein
MFDLAGNSVEHAVRECKRNAKRLFRVFNGAVGRTRQKSVPRQMVVVPKLV